jgi:hypothetical protein
MLARRHLLAVASMLGGLACHVSTPMPLPDAALASGVGISASPASLLIRPGSSGRFRFTVRDSTGAPLTGYPVEFSIAPTAGDTASARLSIEHSLTGATGESVVEVMVGALARNDRPAQFSVKASSPGAPDVMADVLVTTNAYSVTVVPVPAENLLGATGIVETRVYFYDNATCADLDVYDVGATSAQARAPLVLPAGGSYTFSGVAGSGDHAVLGLGLDASHSPRIGGCVDVPGSALVESVPIRTALFLDHLFPVVTGSYQVSSDFQLVPPPKALSGIRSAWQQWSRCPLDPARLWIDCTLAALDTSTNAALCIPETGGLGPVGSLLLASRGAIVPATAGTVVASTDTPCHGPQKPDGSPSLEALIDTLFSDTRAELAAASLASLPDELARTLDDLRLSSRLVLTPSTEANGYWANHDLVGVTLPDGPTPVAFDIAALGLPVTHATGMRTSLRADQVSIASHAFTLRLGTLARYAFEEASLKPRGTSDGADVVAAIFGLARFGSDPSAVLTNCAAFDAVACDQIGQVRGCVLDACKQGLNALSNRLAAVFDDLDGDDLDFVLSGSAPVIDFDGDGRAEQLGMAQPVSGVVAGPGLWSAEILGRAGAYATFGSWFAVRETTKP